MDLINDFSMDHWMSKGYPPQNPSESYHLYSVFQRFIKTDDSLTCYLKADDGKTVEAKLQGVLANHNPLKGLQNAYLKLCKRDEDCIISGIITDFEWLEKKS